MELVRLFGDNVRMARLAKGMTQEQLAVASNMDRSYVSDVERGLRNPTVNALGRLASGLEIEPWKLLLP